MSKKISKTVLVGTVTYKGKDYCRKEFDERRRNLSHPLYAIAEVDTSDYVGSSRDRITKGYNDLLDIFFKGNYDYLLTLEADIIPPKEIIQALLDCDKPVISALYMIGPKDNRYPCAFTGKVTRIKHPFSGEIQKGIVSLTFQDVDGSIKETPGGTGLGCCLIKREVLEKIGKFRYDEAHCDMYFHEDVYKNGYTSWVHTGYICKHYGNWQEWIEKIIKVEGGI